MRKIKNSKMKVIHVALEPTLEKAFAKHEYIFYNYKPFEEEDNVMGMYMRLGNKIRQEDADLLILDFERIDMINLDEYNDLKLLVPCINMRKPLSPDVLTAISNTFVELDNYSRTGKTNRAFKDIPANMTRPKSMCQDAVNVLRKILGI